MYDAFFNEKVPGYGVLEGTEELSEMRNRPFSAFRSVFYAEQPTAETRFLVSQKHCHIRVIRMTIRLRE